MERSKYEKEPRDTRDTRDTRERSIEKEKKVSRDKSKSRSHSRSLSGRRRRRSGSPRRPREDYSRRREYSSKYENSEKYYRKSRSPRIGYRRKTSRENSAENQGNVVYVSNLSKRVQDDEIREKFSKFGKVTEINVVRDPFTKESRGFGFVTMDNRKDALEVIEMLNKTEIDQKLICVEISKRSRPHHITPGVYLGPSNNSSRGRYRHYSPRRRYRSRSRDRSRSRSYNREKYYRRRSRSRSRNRSRSRGRY